MLAKRLLSRVRTWIEIDRKAAEHNYRVFRRLVSPPTALWGVVKSNAYGHGLLTFSKILVAAGIDGLCVDSISEGLALRRQGVKLPILVLGPSLFNLYHLAEKENLILTVPSIESLKAILSQRTPPNFHLKFDTGMYRQGIYPSEAGRVIKMLRHLRRREKFCGVYTHFACGWGKGAAESMGKQFRRLEEIKKYFRRAGFNRLVFHAASTAATIRHKKYHLDAVRVGLGLYGVCPTNAASRQWRRLTLRPVLMWQTLVADIKLVPPGEGIGYDWSESFKHPGRIAVLPIGYWHGLPWSLSSRGEVLINGRRAKIMGRVSMDLTVVNVSRLRCRLGDRVTVIGKSGRQEITAGEIAALSGSTPYEVVTRLNPLMARIVK